MIKRLFSSQIRRNISTSMIVFGVNFIISLVALPIYLHYLGYEKYGVWLVLTTVMTFAQLGNLGIGNAITKYVAEHYAKRDKESIERYVTSAIYALGIIGGLILLLIFCFRAQIIAVFKLGAVNSLLAMELLPYVGLLTLYVFIIEIVAATLSGLNRMDRVVSFQLAGRGISLSTAALLLYSGFGVQSLLIGQFLSQLSYHILCFTSIRRIITIRFCSFIDIDRHSLKGLVRLGSGVMGGRVLDMFLVPVNKLIISRFIGVQAIPIYDISYNVAMNIRGIAAAGLGALTPEVSRLSILAESGSKQIRRIYIKSMKLILLCGAPAFLIVFIFAHPLLQMWLQKTFNPLLSSMLRILLVAGFVSLLGIPAHYTIIGLGSSNKIFLSSVIRSGLNFLGIVLVITLSASLSINTFAWTTAIGMTCATLYLLLQFKKIYYQMETQNA